MKVLMINGSPHLNGNTAIALKELEKTFAAAGVATEIVNLGTQAVRGCIACYKCAEKSQCVFDDIVNQTAPKFAEADGLVIAAPVYYASANATLVAFLQRLFFSTMHTVNKNMKVGASVAVCRRGGASATFDELNKFFTINNMPIVSSQYWNSVHGRTPGEAEQDIEGLQTMRTLARNMTFLMQSIELGKKAYGLPQNEEITLTNFIR